MDFFARQEWARKRTRWLIMLFVLAVIALVIAVNIGSYLAASLGGAWLLSNHEGEIITLSQWFSSSAFAWVSLATIIVIALGSGVNWLNIAGGGTSVAKMVGARRISANTLDSDEKRLLNVVEEMSIASGTPVPQIYVMDNEAAINAFVAGLKNADTVLVVTKGCLTQLNRQELQGVIGHEFSHILHGDMRLNVHLLGVLAGILLIGQLGGFILRHMRYSGSGRSNKDNGGAVAAIAAVGVTLFVVGYLGLFFGRLIKASVSRQREFLADASSVQFTRDNSGIANALAHIQVHAGNSLLMSAHAEDMSHMCFGESVRVGMSGMLATHPPLAERIKVLGFSPDTLLRQAQRRVQEQREQIAQAQKVSEQPSAAEKLEKLAGAAVLATMGTMQPEQLTTARAQLSEIPTDLHLIAHDPTRVKLLLTGLMLSVADKANDDPIALNDDGVAERLQRVLNQFLSEPERMALAQQRSAINSLDPEAFFALVNLCKTALQELDPLARQQTVLCLLGLARADNRFEFAEFVLFSLVRQWALPKKHQGPTLTRFNSVEQSLITVLGAVHRLAGDEKNHPTLNFAQIVKTFGLNDGATVPQVFDAVALDEALETLDRLSPLLKKTLIATLVDMIVADGTVKGEEQALLRAICERLNVPMPVLTAA